MKGRQSDLRRPECHAATVKLVEHPVRQFAAAISPFSRVDTLQILATPEGRYLERTTE
jgi:hypothetical protein